MSQDPEGRRAARKAPITLDRIVDAALHVVAHDGYDALTVRSISAVLGTGPASLYAHVVNKADIDELIIGRLCSEIVLPEPDPAAWREQIAGVCAQIRDQYLRYPGISRAALAMGPTNVETLRVNEGMLAILLAGGVEPRAAAWAIDALSLYVSAYGLERSQRRGSGGDELAHRLTELPADAFPRIRHHAEEFTADTGHERFDFALALMLDNLGG
ncbi:TetR/AcrR family transcriptional regulator [Dactylosporangium sp. NPDC000244]|uniref:TetR/AcrR family transcriptional regulator n=1 Tax=Dactylosporangium sp. NPDC000244 TaxID=3154365 RepID=UPI00332D3E59